MSKIELQQRMRFVPTGMKIREAEDGKKSRTVEGCAIVFGQETTLWDGKYERWREIINKSCITEEFLREQDIKLNLLHNRRDTIARNNKGTGNLVLDLREDGLYFSAELPDCDICNRALAMVETGVYSGCSFEFWSKDYTETVTKLEDGREDYLVEHTSFRSVDALTIAMDPAYEQTSVGLREQFEQREKQHITDDTDPDAEAAKREAEEQAAKEEAERKAAEEAAQREAAEKAAREKFTRERTLRECQASIDTALL